ncbi:MAG: hypothetical protein Q9200_005722 [Gallowayella weberi]
MPDSVVEVADRNASLAAPALKPPSGTISNYTNPYSIRNVYIPVSAGCVFFSSVFVIIRIWTKVVMKKVKGWDDCKFRRAAEIIKQMTYKQQTCLLSQLGVHQWNVPRAHYIKFLKYVYTEELLYCVTIIPTKTSILLQQIHVFIPTKNKLYYLTHSLIWLNAEGNLVTGKCLDHKALIVSGSGLNVLSDFAILVLPTSSIWRLKLPMRKKLRISAVFAMGLL